MTETDSHLDSLIGSKKNKFTIYVLEAGNEVEEISNVKILYRDHIGYTIEAVKYLGKNRRVFIPNSSIVRIRSELH